MLGLVAYSSRTGLGYQTKSLYDNLKPDRVLLIDLSRFNQMPVDYSWYPNADIIRGIPDQQDVDNFVDKCTTILVCETPLNYRMFTYASMKGVRTVQQINPEFLDYYKHFEFTRPSVIGNPTRYHWDRVETVCNNQVLLPVPTELKEKKNIQKVETITHIIGRPTYQDRNGTLDFLKLIRILKNNYSYELFYQTPKDIRAIQYFEPVLNEIRNVQKLGYDISVNVDAEQESLYQNADLLIMPRRYGGLCLPMQEALSRGIPVIMTDTEPNNTELPADWLCSVERLGMFNFHAEVDYFGANIDSLHEVTSRMIENIEISSHIAYEIAKRKSWDIMLPYYQEILK